MYIKSRKNLSVFSESKLLNYAKLYINEYGDLGVFTFDKASTFKLTWTDMKEIYGMKTIKDLKVSIQIDAITDKVIEAIESIEELEKKVKIKEAITLLQSQGYKVEAPYKEPSDEEIVARVKWENEKIGYVADWNDFDECKYTIIYNYENYKYELDGRGYRKAIGEIYTTKEIACKIIDELNEKRFERVGE